MPAELPKVVNGVELFDILEDDKDHSSLPKEQFNTLEQLPGGSTGNSNLDELLRMDTLPVTAEEMASLTDDQKDELRENLVELTKELTGQLTTVTQEMARIKSVLHGSGGILLAHSFCKPNVIVLPDVRRFKMYSRFRGSYATGG